ncbi:MAG: hypothetical protein ACLP5E_09880 [Streptosporangiaceae bacterium]
MAVELAGGVTVYPAWFAGDRWRAVWYEGGRRRQCQAATGEGLAARVEKITAQLGADAPGLERPGADLIAYYLSTDRLPAGRPWSRKHADTQRRLCARFVAPVIAGVACEDIRTGHMQAVVNAAPTAGEGARVRRCVSALVSAGLAGGYLLSPRLREVHWQAAGRPVPVPETGIAGESALFVDPAEIPAREDVTRLGRALAVLAGDYELMACFAAYTGLRWDELAALTVTQVDQGIRTVTVDRKVIEVGGQQYAEAPKGRKQRRTIYPRQAPPAISASRMPVARNTAMIAASRRWANVRPAHAWSIRDSSSAVKTGTSFSAAAGGRSPAIGSGIPSSAASHRKNCCRARYWLLA